MIVLQLIALTVSAYSPGLLAHFVGIAVPLSLQSNARRTDCIRSVVYLVREHVRQLRDGAYTQRAMYPTSRIAYVRSPRVRHVGCAEAARKEPSATLVQLIACFDSPSPNPLGLRVLCAIELVGPLKAWRLNSLRSPLIRTSHIASAHACCSAVARR
jgi:hypothetical protein